MFNLKLTKRIGALNKYIRDAIDLINGRERNATNRQIRRPLDFCWTLLEVVVQHSWVCVVTSFRRPLHVQCLLCLQGDYSVQKALTHRVHCSEEQLRQRLLPST